MASTGEVVDMAKELYIAAVKGNIELLQQAPNDEYLLSKTYEKNNIIHIASRHEQHDFIQAILRRFPNNDNLVCHKNSSGNTPFHVAAEVGNFSIVNLLYDYSTELEVEGDNDVPMPWRMINLEGNTPLHVAIIHNNVKVARFLLDKDLYLASIVNECMETPLHLAIKHHVNYSESQSTISKIKQTNDVVGASIKYEPGEDMSSLINLLVEKEKTVTCWPDINGSTPLHRAAFLNKPYNIQVIRSIIYHCPQSTEVCDSSGKTILHLLVGRMPTYQDDNLLPNLIFALKNYQDQQGNTPLHIAANNMDVDMVRLLLQSSAKLSIVNKQGISVASLIQQKNLAEMLSKRKMTKEECEALEKADIGFLRERKSKLGKLFLHSRDSKDRNILHMLMYVKDEIQIKNNEDFVDFIQEIFSDLPALVEEIDLQGNTPVHVLAQNHPNTTLGRSILLALVEICSSYLPKMDEDSSKKSPCLKKNAEGNTPLHEALKAKNINLVRSLFKHDSRSAGLKNSYKEMPLHLLAAWHIVSDKDKFKSEEIKSMLEANPDAISHHDQNGLTPLLRAFQANNLEVAKDLCIFSPKGVAEDRDADGQTFWHLFVNHPSGNPYVSRLLQNATLRGVLKDVDKTNGNTPLHSAITNDRFDVVELFLSDSSSYNNEDKWLSDLLHIRNKAGKTPAEQIAESTCLPSNIEKSILGNNKMIGVRSVWGIPTSEMKTYVNTIGIIAALLTTITFTAAFTVPGGLIQNNGTELIQHIGSPVLMRNTIFQVFMISDIIAMCLSMMVLFCLLWIMATSDRRLSVMILDLAIWLLIGSFFATFLTFMMGLYATTSSVKKWIAIFTLIICSLITLLVQKFLVTKLLIPLKKAILRLGRLIWRWCKNSTKWCKTSLSKRTVGTEGNSINQRSLNIV